MSWVTSAIGHNSSWFGFRRPNGQKSNCPHFGYNWRIKFPSFGTFSVEFVLREVRAFTNSVAYKFFVQICTNFIRKAFTKWTKTVFRTNMVCTNPDFRTKPCNFIHGINLRYKRRPFVSVPQLLRLVLNFDTTSD